MLTYYLREHQLLHSWRYCLNKHDADGFVKDDGAPGVRKKTRPEALLKPLEAPLEILGEPHIPREQLASSGEFHPVRLDALSQSRVEVLFHAAKVRKGLIYANIIY